MEAAMDHKMSVEDFSVRPPTEEPHRLFTSQPPSQAPTAPTNTTVATIIHALTTPESTLHQTTITTGAKRNY
jgi:hypothetical protein